MPNRVTWDADFQVGHELIDEQHRRLLDQCNLLADHCVAATKNEPAFDQAFEQLRTMAREHFEAELALRVERNDPELEDHRDECDEFEYLADEIVTTENFDRLELQRFLALWWVGHVTSSARELRALLAG